jgi:hypothetical protein
MGARIRHEGRSQMPNSKRGGNRSPLAVPPLDLPFLGDAVRMGVGKQGWRAWGCPCQMDGCGLRQRQRIWTSGAYW